MFLCRIRYAGHEQTEDGLGVDGNGSITDPMHAHKPTRGRYSHAKQSPPSSTTAAAAAVSKGGLGKNKNAVMLLNELQPDGLRYNGVTKSGPDNKPLYTANITVYGQVGINQSTFYLHRCG